MISFSMVQFLLSFKSLCDVVEDFELLFPGRLNCAPSADILNLIERHKTV